MKLTLKSGVPAGVGVVIRPIHAGRTPKGLQIGKTHVPVLTVPKGVGKLVHTRVGSVDLLLVSVGSKARCSAEHVRQACGTASRWLHEQSMTTAALDGSGVLSLGVEGALRAAFEGLLLGDFTFDRHRTNSNQRKQIRIAVMVDRVKAADRRELTIATAACAGTNLARRIAHEPPNELNPERFAAEARKVAKTWGLKCRVLTERQMATMGMGGMLNVGKGSDSPPRMIVLEYGSRRTQRPIVIIGKAITFDTGGYSLKTTDGMVGMKYDKCGGAAVLGLMRAIGELKPRQSVVGVIASAENMVSPSAYRPDDIIRMMSGKTVEIVSTDAEGRLVLADALTYAQRTFKPRAMIDLATLTGGILVALGRVAAGVFCDDEQLRESLLESGRRTHERLWPMPLWDDYDALLKSDDADMKNSGGRRAHPVIGGVFLKAFVDSSIPWAHLDIAGTATVEESNHYCPKGATGFGVRLLVDYLFTQ